MVRFPIFAKIKILYKKDDIFFWRFTKNRVFVYQDFTNWKFIKDYFRKLLMKDQYLKRIY